MTNVHLGQQHARPVQVLTAEGSWVDGWLEAYRKVEGVWSGFVRYSTAPSETYLGWVRGGTHAGRRPRLTIFPSPLPGSGHGSSVLTAIGILTDGPVAVVFNHLAT